MHTSSNYAGETSEVEQIRHDVDRENTARVAAMFEEEREEELRELRERFGDSVMDALKRRAAARQSHVAQDDVSISATICGDS